MFQSNVKGTRCPLTIVPVFPFSIVIAWRSAHCWEVNRVDEPTEYEGETSGFTPTSVQSGGELWPQGHAGSSGDGGRLQWPGHRLLRHDRETRCGGVESPPQVLRGGEWGGHRGRSCDWNRNSYKNKTNSRQFPLWPPFPVLHQAQQDQQHPFLRQSLFPLDVISQRLHSGDIHRAVPEPWLLEVTGSLWFIFLSKLIVITKNVLVEIPCLSVSLFPQTHVNLLYLPMVTLMWTKCSRYDKRIFQHSIFTWIWNNIAAVSNIVSTLQTYSPRHPHLFEFKWSVEPLHARNSSSYKIHYQ